MVNEKYLNEIKADLIKYAEDDDVEMSHIYADAVICELLEKLGYQEIVDLYREIGKWYA